MIPTSIEGTEGIDAIREVIADIDADPYLVFPFMSPAFAGLVVVRTIKSVMTIIKRRLSVS
jgi:hypothetical protein